jgi:hypothetical protein
MVDGQDGQLGLDSDGVGYTILSKAHSKSGAGPNKMTSNQLLVLAMKNQVFGWLRDVLAAGRFEDLQLTQKLSVKLRFL